MNPDDLLAAGMPIAERLASEWGLVLGAPFVNATNCLVLRASHAGEQVVLRVPLCPEESGPGYHAQIAFSTGGGVSILARDEDTGSVLMPLISPGTMLSDAGLSAEEEVAACCSVILRFQPQMPATCMRIEDWYEPFLQVTSAVGIPDGLLMGAQRLADELLSSGPAPVLLHGDLHHFNLLDGGGVLFAIDPKGVVGDPCLEPAAFIRNPFTTIEAAPDLPELMRIRIRTFADLLGLEAGRIWKWAIAQNVLSAWWDEDEGRGRTIRIVEAVRRAEP